MIRSSRDNLPISVVMPVYNCEKYIAYSIESILSQSFKAFELIIVDDGSSDNSMSIIQSYKDKRIRIITNPNNIGLTKSLNKAINCSKGEYIARMDADDISLVDRLEKQSDFMEDNPKVAVLGGGYQEIDSDGRLINYVFKPPVDKETIEHQLLFKKPFANPIVHSTAIIRRTALEDVGRYRVPFQAAQDYDLWLRISEKFEIQNMDEILIYYRYHPDSIFNKSVFESTIFPLVARASAQMRRRGLKDPVNNEVGLTSEVLMELGLTRGIVHKYTAKGYFLRSMIMLGKGEVDKAISILHDYKRSRFFNSKTLGISFYYLRLLILIVLKHRDPISLFSLLSRSHNKDLHLFTEPKEGKIEA